MESTIPLKFLSQSHSEEIWGPHSTKCTVVESGTRTCFKALKQQAPPFWLCGNASKKVCNFAAQNIDEYAAMLLPQVDIRALFHAVAEFNP